MEKKTTTKNATGHFPAQLHPSDLVTSSVSYSNLLLKNSSELDFFKENVPSNSHTNTVFGSVFTTRREGFQNRVVENICQRY